MRVFRVLPATIFIAVLLVVVKVINLVSGVDELLIYSVEAQQPEKPSNVSEENPAAKSNDNAAKEDSKTKKDKKNEDKEGDKNPENTSENKSESEKEEKKKKENPAVSDKVEESTDHRFTAVEVELLQSLSKRREELDRWEDNIKIKESVLDAAEKRIDEKIQQIEGMKKQVAALLAQYNKQEDAKINSLVKIYENMKPAEAARIFDEVEMPILLLVIDAMAEKKAAPILAAMEPKKAKQLTVELANERRINSKVTGSAASQISSPEAN